MPVQQEFIGDPTLNLSGSTRSRRPFRAPVFFQSAARLQPALPRRTISSTRRDFIDFALNKKPSSTHFDFVFPFCQTWKAVVAIRINSLSCTIDPRRTHSNPVFRYLSIPEQFTIPSPQGHHHRLHCTRHHLQHHRHLISCHLVTQQSSSSPTRCKTEDAKRSCHTVQAHGFPGSSHSFPSVCLPLMTSKH